MGRIAYAKPSDNVAPDATITASDEDTNYPAENLANLDPSNPAKLTTTEGYWLLDLGAPVTIVGAAVINHNLDQGLGVYVEGDADGGSPIAFSQQLIIPLDDEEGFSVNPWVLFDAPETYRYWRLNVAGANSVPVAIGEFVLLEAIRSLTQDWAPGLTEDEERSENEHRSALGVGVVYTRGAKWKVWEGEIPAVSSSGAEEFLALSRGARGRSSAWLFVPDDAVNASYLVTFDANVPIRKYTDLVNQIPFRLRELSRGVPL